MTQNTGRDSGRQSGLFAGLAMAALLAAAPAHGETSHAIHIAAGPLDAALLKLAAQTHEQLLYTPSLVAGRTSPAINGQLTAEQALARMLQSSEITVSRTSPSMLVLRAANAATSLPAGQAVSPPREVEGDRPFVVEASPTPNPTAPRRVLGAEAAREAMGATVSEIEVTGTHIRGAGKGPSPVVVLGRQNLDRLGQITVAGALGAIPQNFSGEDTEQAKATGADHLGVNNSYATGVNLRGLGSNATLVLLNGRRLGGAGEKGDFTDVSALPSIAVDRVDLLLDGASAIYGSDAVGGVVNIILRRDLNGAEVRAEAGVGSHSTPREQQLGLIGGRTWQDGGVLLAYELYSRTALNAADRSFTASANLRSRGGSDFRQTFGFPGNIISVTPAGLSPFFAIPVGQNGVGLTASSFQPGSVNLYNQHLGVQVLPDQQRQTGYLAAHQTLGDRVELTGEVLYGFRRARATLAAPLAFLSVSSTNPFYVSPLGGPSEFIEYAFGDLPSPVARITAETLAVTAGAKVDLWRDWRSDSFISVSEDIEDSRAHGILNSLVLSEALGNSPDSPATAYSPARDGFYNPFTGQPSASNAAALKAIGSGFSNQRTHGQVTTASTQADGSLMTLPGGALKLALGAQVREERFASRGSAYAFTAAPVAQVLVDDKRTVGALFAELRAPIVGPDNRGPGFEALEVSAAARWEHYSDFGSTLNPKVGVLWTPIADLDLRATYGRSFRAPGLREVNDPFIYSPGFFIVGSGRVLGLLAQGGNPNLRPETADSWTVGLDWRPSLIQGLWLSLTGYGIRYQHRIDRPVLANIAHALTDPTVGTFVRHLDPTNAADLATISALLASPQNSTAQGVFPAASYGAIVDARYVNTGALDVDGLDLTGGYSFDGLGGRFDLGGNASELLRYAQASTPASPALARAGVVGFPAKFRGRLTADWTRGGLTLGMGLNRTGAFHDDAGVHVDGLTTVDLQMRLAASPTSRWAGVTVALNARNIFDTAPPFYDNASGFGFDGANADLVGRFVSLQLAKNW
jgi:iron complex outermembrane receptor protein